MIQKPPVLITLLAHELRWSIVRILSKSDRRVNELVDLLDQPMNLISYHLKQLRDGGLVITRRSEADGRDVYYSLDLDALALQYEEIRKALYPLLPDNSKQTSPVQKRILFICTHNSARSQMAEALMHQISDGSIEAHSAGSHPTTIHPDAIHTMQAHGIDLSHKHSTHVNTYLGERFDYVVTVCDNAREVCPTFPGGTQLHWGYADPTMIKDPEQRLEAFQQIARRLKTRIEFFLTEIIQQELS